MVNTEYWNEKDVKGAGRNLIRRPVPCLHEKIDNTTENLKTRQFTDRDLNPEPREQT